jgi:hypothetical protein
MNPEIRNRYHQLLGAYIARTTNIESLMDSIFTFFFNIDGRVSFEFESWVLGRVDFSMKLDLLRQVADKLGQEKARFKPLSAGLQGMMKRRNELAHGHFTQITIIHEDGSRTDSDLVWINHRKYKGDAPDPFRVLDLNVLQGDLEALDDLEGPLRELLRVAYGHLPKDEVAQHPFVSHSDGNILVVLDKESTPK